MQCDSESELIANEIIYIFYIICNDEMIDRGLFSLKIMKLNNNRIDIALL